MKYTKKNTIILILMLAMLIFSLFYSSFSLQEALKETIFSGINIILLLLCNIFVMLLVFYIELFRRYQHNVNIDPLTGFYKKDFFQLACEKKIKKEPTTSFAIILIDLSYYSNISKDAVVVLGSAELMQETASRLRDSINNRSVYGKYGMDCFILMIPYDKEEDILYEINKINGEMSLLTTAGISLFYTISYVNGDLNVDTAIQKALFAMKHSERNLLKNYCFYSDELMQTIQEQEYLTANMKQALENEEFKLYLQPKFNLFTHECVGAEALVRWKHKEQGIIPPERFIHLFEKNAFIYHVDYYIWNQTCRFLQECKENEKDIVPISINISRKDLNSGVNLTQVFTQLIHQYALDKSLLQLELTESMFSTQNSTEIYQVIDELRRSGFTICMDDFGSEYSSLNMLKECTVDIIKIDKNFLQGFTNEHSTAGVILEHMIELIRDLGMQVVVEGIETREQVELLKKKGCIVGQGYYYSKPVPAKDFYRFLQKKIPQIHPF